VPTMSSSKHARSGRLKGQIRIKEMGGNDLIKVSKFHGGVVIFALITTIENGWVEWLASETDCGEEVLSGLRLV
jgi:hypothetical protein